ncbi:MULTISPECIES: M48 metallopeptidase family protein [Micrococcaceae]|jgi:Predicted metal-dependent hydrolase|uniref:M48 metallopeptidase family protein n=1 Tax=Micrococcaceae TaxID=1268 RepID=UPI000CFDA596|nr:MULTISPECIES: M48 family metallopeptidase [Micrococcaceae]PRB71193.1 metal-dependent hydrolase [Arthrobacter sp. MYb213]HJX77712.1 M48 family metallopeptidase [Glutamicibacter sp.]
MPNFPQTVEFIAADDIPVRIVRSNKRKKTISSQWRDNRLVVQVPAALNESTERVFVDEMLKKYRQRKNRESALSTEDSLMDRAKALDAKYLGGIANPLSVRWVNNQNKRWGSATPYQRSIRLSAKLKYVPIWVQDYVLVHELVHLATPGQGHGNEFQQLLDRFERRVEADQFLAGFSAGFNAYAKENGQTELEAGGFDDLEDN